LLRGFAGTDLLMATPGGRRYPRPCAGKSRNAELARVELAERDVPALPCPAGTGAMEIRLADGTAIVVGADVSEEALLRVLAALGR
jgi:hypothetical protein